MNVTEELVRNVVQEVLASMRSGKPAATNGQAHRRGVFEDVNEAVAAAVKAQREFERRGLDDRRKAVACVRKVCVENAEQLGREEFEETKIGRLPHKIEKLVVCGERIPGVEFLRTDAITGDKGVTL